MVKLMRHCEGSCPWQSPANIEPANKLNNPNSPILNILPQFFPLRIQSINECFFPLSIPTFQLLFSFNGRHYSWKIFETYKFEAILFCSKTIGKSFCSVLPDSYF